MNSVKDRLEILEELLNKDSSNEMVISTLQSLIKLCKEQQDEIANLRRMILSINLGSELCE